MIHLGSEIVVVGDDLLSVKLPASELSAMLDVWRTTTWLSSEILVKCLSEQTQSAGKNSYSAIPAQRHLISISK